MRELLRAVVFQKRMFALLDPDTHHGGLSSEEVWHQLSENDAHDFYEKCGLAAEVREWGQPMPTAEKLYELLFNEDVVEWNRIGIFQVIVVIAHGA